MSARVDASLTLHRLTTWDSAPASTSARRMPYTPSPDGTAPTPVWHADKTTSWVPHQSKPAISRAVTMPPAPWLAPAIASPDRSRPSAGSLDGSGGDSDDMPPSISTWMPRGASWADAVGGGT